MEKERNRRFLKETKESPELALIAVTHRWADSLRCHRSLGAGPTAGTSPGQAPRKPGVGVSTGQDDGRTGGTRGALGSGDASGDKQKDRRPACAACLLTGTTEPVAGLCPACSATCSCLSPFHQRLPACLPSSPDKQSLGVGWLLNPATLPTDELSQELPACLSPRAELPDAACNL